MIKSVRAAAAVALAAPLLAAVFAAPANAAPDDVTLAAEVEGNDVWVTLTNNSQGEIVCQWNERNTTNPSAEPNVFVTTQIQRGYERRIGATFVDGDYQIWWTCSHPDTSETWGTGETGRKTAEPFPFTTSGSTDDDSTGPGSLEDFLGTLGLGGLEGILEILGLGGLEGILGTLDAGSLEGILGTLDAGSLEGILGTLDAGSLEGILGTLDAGSLEGALGARNSGSLEGVLGFS
ncbi:hypothetical protein [Rhodococcus xishaensis]|uniref:Uncharacterized protein n=1 Tax=Rhodococcus xishaensis TaxID=2487364 RepID=A0A438B3A7_9NOCA|nr:hypothetical protein [Rhodococcus xishaensis]RVW05464.1 hypothetical protein EGT50_02430 [Rhodococcus xishaensis]